MEAKTIIHNNEPQKNHSQTSEYKKDWWEKKGKQYKRIASSYSNEDYALISNIAKKLNKSKSEVVSLASMRALREEETTASFTNSLQALQYKQDLVREVLFTLNKIGTNINQIVRDVNERRLFYGNSNLSKNERKKMLEATENLENVLINFINKAE
jgi:hypothetical protein